MVVLAKGKLSYYILSCLAERDMYGLELIEQIKMKFGVDIKLPSLYSNLNRMKELKFVSTYLKESNKGPKCSYSSITVRGRNELETLKQTWEIETNDSPTLLNEKTKESERAEIENVTEQQNDIKNDDQECTNSDLTDDYNDFFDLNQEDEGEEENKTSVLAQETVQSEVYIDTEISRIDEVRNDIDMIDEIDNKKTDTSTLFSSKDELVENTTSSPMPKIAEESDNKDKNIINEHSEIISYIDNVTEVKEISQLKEEYFQHAEEDENIEKQDDYAQFTENKKLFDITQDFSKYKKKKSFTENQLVMNVNTASVVNEDKKQNDVSTLKQTIQNSRDGNYEPIDRFAEKEEQSQEPTTISKNLNNNFEILNPTVKDDGIFITDRIPQHEIPKAKKIETAKLSFTVQNDYSNKFPAPRRDASVDPSCSDVKARLQKLYEKTVAKEEAKKKSFREYETFDELKSYYETQDIDFKIYDKPEGKIRHNTNKLLLITELILFGFTGISSLLFYLIFKSVGGVNYDYSFLYYLFPVISLVVLCYRFYNYKLTVSRVPKPMLKPLILWMIFLLSSIMIFCFALICGLNLRSPVTYCTCIIYPIIILGIWFVARQYLTLLLYKKYWK